MFSDNDDEAASPSSNADAAADQGEERSRGDFFSSGMIFSLIGFLSSRVLGIRQDEFWSPVWTRNSLDSFSPSFPEPSSSSGDGDGGPSLSVLSEEVVCTICLGHPRGNVYQVRKNYNIPSFGKVSFFKKIIARRKKHCHYFVTLWHWRWIGISFECKPTDSSMRTFYLGILNWRWIGISFECPTLNFIFYFFNFVNLQCVSGHLFCCDCFERCPPACPTCKKAVGKNRWIVIQNSKEISRIYNVLFLFGSQKETVTTFDGSFVCINFWFWGV